MTQPKYVIVVGIDYSAASERALDEALALGSSKHGVQLHVVNVRSAANQPSEATEEPSAAPPWRYWASELQEFVARKVAAFQASAGASPPPFQHLHTHQRMNDPARELAQLALSVEADLIVVGSHDWHGAAARQSSVAEAVTRLAPCPVLVVRRKGEPVRASAIQPP